MMIRFLLPFILFISNSNLNSYSLVNTYSIDHPYRNAFVSIPSRNSLYVYLEGPFQRFCLLANFKGFYVGRSDDGKNCYYVCPNDPRIIPTGVITYLCCSSGFSLNFYTKICVRTQKNFLGSKYSRWNFKRENYMRRNGNIGQKYSYCSEGLFKPHPNDCQRYYRCVFNLQYIEMKCPFGFQWNPRWKICDFSYQCPTSSINSNHNIITKINVSPSYAMRNRFYDQKNSLQKSKCYNNRWQRKFFRKLYGTDCQPSSYIVDGIRMVGKNNIYQSEKKSFNSYESKQYETKSIKNIPHKSTNRWKFWQKLLTTSTTTTVLPENTEMSIERDIKNTKIPKHSTSTTTSIETTSFETTSIDLTSTTIDIDTINSTIDSISSQFTDTTTEPTKSIFNKTSTTEIVTTTESTMTTLVTDTTISTKDYNELVEQTLSTLVPESSTPIPIDITTISDTTTTIREPLVFEENSRCYEPTARYKDNEDCQCFYQCEFNKRLTRNCCPEGLFFNQQDYEPSVNRSNPELEINEWEEAYCDFPENIECKTIIQ